MDIVPKTFELIVFGKKHISRNHISNFSISMASVSYDGSNVVLFFF